MFFSKFKNINFDIHIVSISLMIMFFLPHLGYFYYVNPALAAALAFRYHRPSGIGVIKILIVAIMLISMFGYLFTIDKIVFKAVSRGISLIFLFSVFPFVKNFKIPNVYIYSGLGFIILSQMVYVIGFWPLISFFSTLYPYEGDEIIYRSDFLYKHSDSISIANPHIRLGGIFHNPNQGARYVTFLYAVFFIENKDNASIKKTKLLISAIVLISILYTGSRTGFIVFSLLFYFFYFGKNTLSLKSALISGLFLIISVILFSLLDIYFFDTVRVFDIEDALSYSLVPKIRFFLEYYETQNNFFQILFGNFDMDLSRYYVRSAEILDSEWGNAIFNYGVLFFISAILFYSVVYKGYDHKTKPFFIIILWIFSSSLIFSYRASFLFLFLLSKYYVNPLKLNNLFNNRGQSLKKHY
jgi:hypothetical protein